MKVWVLVSWILAGMAGPAGAWAVEDLPALIGPYLSRRDHGHVGQVSGQAHGEPRRPGEGPPPRESVLVFLLPYSAELEGELASIKSTLRDSPRSYTEAAGRVEAARGKYEGVLRRVGGAVLVRSAVTDKEGRFGLTEVPEGRWLLLASLEQQHSLRVRQDRRRQAGRFPDNPESPGYAAVSFWLFPVEVKDGETASVDLHERNVWLTGIRPRLAPPREAPAKSPGKHR